MQNQTPQQGYYPPQGQQGYYPPHGQQQGYPPQDPMQQAYYPSQGQPQQAYYPQGQPQGYPPQGQQQAYYPPQDPMQQAYYPPQENLEPEYYQPGEKVDWFALPKAYALNMKRQEKYKWFKPILAAVIGGALGVVFMFVTSGICLFLQSLIEPGFASDITTIFKPETLMDPTRPLMFLMSLLSLAVFIPAIMIAMKITGLGGIGTFSSVAGRLRWDRIRGYVGWLILVMFVGITFDIGYSAFHYGADVALAGLRFLPLTLVFVFICAPLQSAAEEYGFRGFVMQTLSGWLPLVIVPIVPLLVQAVLFGSLHSQYNILGLIATGWMGLIAGFVTIKTGGLECAICIHAVNNTISMAATTLIVSSAPSEVTVGAFLIDFILIICFALISLWISKRKGWILK